MIKVLDYGSVDLMSHTDQGDLLVVNAARCSFNKQHKGLDVEKDERLINYLAREKHLLPFRHPSATLRITAPIFVLRQLMKHQVGFSWSEVSRRYITGTPDHYLPDPDQLRATADNVKQGSSHASVPEVVGEELHEEMEELYDLADYVYTSMLGRGVCPEQARMVLPQAMYSTTVVTGSLLGWHHLVTQRTEAHAQKETKDFASAINILIGDLFPLSWEALCKHS
tara:strand:+ start:147 stop:821 length:675 start_codon:yes stop_codon:yes gene_type:complete